MKRTMFSGERWAVILAGGEGTRLSSLAQSRFGEHRPKQYCAFLGERSMFDHTLARAAGLVGRQRVVTVIGRGHLRYLDARQRAELVGYVVEQPRNCDTAPGVFLPLTYVMAHDPEATVLIFPSDHYIHPNERFLAVMDRAAGVAERLRNRLVLASAVADRPEREYGWIQPGADIPDLEEPDARSVLQFHEKPDAAAAERFYGEGFLWNTLNMAVRAQTLWSLGWSHHPSMMDRFESLRVAIETPAEAAVLASIYEDMPAVNFSRGILERASARSVVLPMRDVEWSDWGHPDRIRETLEKRCLYPSRPFPAARPLLAPAAA